MKIAVGTMVRGEPERLFGLSQNYARRTEWDSFLSEAYLIEPARQPGLGVDSYCRSKAGSVMISRYISYKPPHAAAVAMLKGPWVLESFHGTWNFKAQAHDHTLVGFTYNFRTRPWLLRWLLEPFIGFYYRRDMTRRLAHFRQWAEALQAD
ncbi:SRPBCC family protein [Dyella sp. OK004]|uniref:SRPBCC family protein n=1 Tax=Dyella sp. OK004 TaxID=1855292 RepID=UPI000B896C0E|nr:SRPBCC family protein [Dyella sp. OK004]